MERNEFKQLKEIYWKNNDWWGFIDRIDAAEGIDKQYLADVEVLKTLGYAYSKLSQELSTGVYDEAYNRLTARNAIKDNIEKSFNRHLKYILLAQKAYQQALMITGYDNMLYVSFAYFYYNIYKNANQMNNYYRKSREYADNKLYAEYEKNVKNVCYHEAQRLYRIIFAHNDATVKNHYRYAKLLIQFADQYEYVKPGEKKDAMGKTVMIGNAEQEKNKKNQAYKKAISELEHAISIYESGNEAFQKREYKEYCKSLYNLATVNCKIIEKGMATDYYFKFLSGKSSNMVFYHSYEKHYTGRRENKIIWKQSLIAETAKCMKKLLALPEYQKLAQPRENILALAQAEGLALNTYDITYRMGMIYHLKLWLSFTEEYSQHKRYQGNAGQELLHKRRQELFEQAESYYLATLEIKGERRKLRKSVGGFFYELKELNDLYVEIGNVAGAEKLLAEYAKLLVRKDAMRHYCRAMQCLFDKSGVSFSEAEQEVKALLAMNDRIYGKKALLLERYIANAKSETVV